MGQFPSVIYTRNVLICRVKGLDWHGPSTIEAFASIDALYSVLQSRSAWRPWAIEEHTRVLVIGHSNGGQGTWFVTSRFPDRIVASGYFARQQLSNSLTGVL